MKTVYKYPFPIQEVFSVLIPIQSKILKIDLDPTGAPCIWAEVDTDVPVASYDFAIVGTGREIPEVNYGHVWSFIQGPFVWHIYRLN